MQAILHEQCPVWVIFHILSSQRFGSDGELLDQTPSFRELGSLQQLCSCIVQLGCDTQAFAQRHGVLHFDSRVREQVPETGSFEVSVVREKTRSVIDFLLEPVKIFRCYHEIVAVFKLGASVVHPSGQHLKRWMFDVSVHPDFRDVQRASGFEVQTYRHLDLLS